MGAFENHSGKISATIFKEDLLGSCGAQRKEVVRGPKFGVDAAIIDLGNGKGLATSSDPLSLIPSLGMKVSAWLSVHLLVNDISTTGYAPQYAQFVLNLPDSLSREDFNEYWQHIHELCDNLDIAITGGHTGQIPGQQSTISGGGTMFLQAPLDRLITSNNARPGDKIIVTKQAALSSTSLLAMAFPKTVSEKLGNEIQQKASNNFWKLSVLPEAKIASQTLKPNEELHAMHDVTEGGVLGALYEMGQASGCGFEVEIGKIPVGEETQLVADLFEIDPLISVGAGSMIIAVGSDSEATLLNSLSNNGIPAAVIGTFTEDTSCIVKESTGSGPFRFDGEDPYWGAFFKAVNMGWE